MNRDAELDLLSADSQAWLADTTITVAANRPDGVLNTATLQRVVDADAPEDSGVPAVREEDEIGQDGDKRTVRRAWIVRTADLTFTPARHNATVTDAGVAWRVLRAVPMNDGRELRILGERLD